MRTDLRSFLVAVAVCIAVVFVIALGTEEPATFAGRNGGSGLWSFLYDFQTLIAGIAAVTAAAITVFQMQVTDAASENRFRDAEQATAARHRQLIELQTRADRTRVQRALVPQHYELNLHRKDLADCADQAGEMLLPLAVAELETDFFLPDPFVFEQFILRCYPIALAAHSLLKRPQLVEGASLFDGELTYRLEKLRQLTSTVVVEGEELYRYHRYPKSRVHDSEQRYMNELASGAGDTMILFPRQFATQAMKVLERMTLLARLYDISEDGVS